MGVYILFHLIKRNLRVMDDTQGVPGIACDQEVIDIQPGQARGAVDRFEEVFKTIDDMEGNRLVSVFGRLLYYRLTRPVFSSFSLLFFRKHL